MEIWLGREIFSLMKKNKPRLKFPRFSNVKNTLLHIRIRLPQFCNQNINLPFPGFIIKKVWNKKNTYTGTRDKL